MGKPDSDESNQVNAATKIQAVHRGKATRKSLSQISNSNNDDMPQGQNETINKVAKGDVTPVVDADSKEGTVASDMKADEKDALADTRAPSKASALAEHTEAVAEK